MSTLTVFGRQLVHRGHTVMIESGAGAGAGLGDSDYRAAGGTLVEWRNNFVRDPHRRFASA